MLTVGELISRLDELNGQVVTVVGPCAYAADSWLFTPADPRGRVRLCLGGPGTHEWLFKEPRTAGVEPQGVVRTNVHAAVVTVCGRVRPSSSPDFAADLDELQWCTHSYPPERWALPRALLFSLAGPHPLLQHCLSVTQVIEMREALYGRPLRVGGRCVKPRRSPHVYVAAAVDDLAAPSRRVRLERRNLALEYRVVVTEQPLRSDGELVGDCIVSAVLCPDVDDAAVLRYSSEFCVATALRDRPCLAYHAYGGDYRELRQMGSRGLPGATQS
jgi:hypothetical protein